MQRTSPAPSLWSERDCGKWVGVKTKSETTTVTTSESVCSFFFLPAIAAEVVSTAVMSLCDVTQGSMFLYPLQCTAAVALAAALDAALAESATSWTGGLPGWRVSQSAGIISRLLLLLLLLFLFLLSCCIENKIYLVVYWIFQLQNVPPPELLMLILI